MGLDRRLGMRGWCSDWDVGIGWGLGWGLG